MGVDLPTPLAPTGPYETPFRAIADDPRDDRPLDPHRLTGQFALVDILLFQRDGLAARRVG